LLGFCPFIRYAQTLWILECLQFKNPENTRSIPTDWSNYLYLWFWIEYRPRWSLEPCACWSGPLSRSTPYETLFASHTQWTFKSRKTRSTTHKHTPHSWIKKSE
jgi:hypothetical protein